MFIGWLREKGTLIKVGTNIFQARKVQKSKNSNKTTKKFNSEVKLLWKQQ